MKRISNKKNLINILNNEKSLGFVPTMGGLHSGHKSLIKKSISQCNKTIVSIFVNKPQFNKKNDYLSYPRKTKKDISILKKLKVDYLYLPKIKEIYPKGPNTRIKISNLEYRLCGKNRPKHFRAVVDVIDRFIKLIKPKNIYMGEKDMQQLEIIKHFFKVNKIKTKVVGCKTVREKNGVACSSRNFNLSRGDKFIASNIYKILKMNKKKMIKNKLYLQKLKKKIIKLGANKIDYLKILNINNLTGEFKKKKKYKIFIAYYIKSIRLIDNF